jgi:hypothetical protein
MIPLGKVVFNGIAFQESGTLWSFKRRCLHIIFLALQPRPGEVVIPCKSVIWKKDSASPHAKWYIVRPGIDQEPKNEKLDESVQARH